MNCEQVAPFLADYALRDLNHETQHATAHHLSQCGDCARAYCALEMTVAELAEVAAAGPPEDVRGRLHPRLFDKPERRIEWRRLARPAATAASVAAICLFALFHALQPPANDGPMTEPASPVDRAQPVADYGCR